MKYHYLLLPFPFLLLMGSSSCGGKIKYQDDSSFLSSAQSNSYELPAYVEGQLCQDMDGKSGACVKQVPSDQPIKFSMDPRSTPYTLQFYCSKIDMVEWDKDVPKDAPFSWQIEVADFSDWRSFTCEGEIFPHDRTNPDSAKFQVRILVYDAAYHPREEMHYVGNYFVLGQYAKYSRVCFKDGECKSYKEKAALKDKDRKIVSASSESERLRYNQWPMR